MVTVSGWAGITEDLEFKVYGFGVQGLSGPSEKSTPNAKIRIAHPQP